MDGKCPVVPFADQPQDFVGRGAYDGFFHLVGTQSQGRRCGRYPATSGKDCAKKGIDVVVCIDEFQQIAEFKDSKAFQKRLRSVWQLQKSASYCLFGSKKHLMNELFEKKSLPFYKFGDTVYLPKIGTEDWVDYICGRFEATGKHISAELAGKICRAVDNHSSYVQQLAWLVWIHTDETATEQDFEGAYQDIIDQNTPLFEKQTESLTAYQMNFFAGRTGGGVCTGNSLRVPFCRSTNWARRPM